MKLLQIHNLHNHIALPVTHWSANLSDTLSREFHFHKTLHAGAVDNETMIKK